MPQNAASDLGLHCLQPILQLLDSSTCSKMYAFKFKDDIGALCPFQQNLSHITSSCGHGTKAVIQNHKSINE